MIGRIAMGIQTPIIREGDDLTQIVLDSILRTTEIQDGDIIGITESIVARAAGLYVTVDEIAEDIRQKFSKNKTKTITVVNPIYSRNRFSMILKGIARAAEDYVVLYLPEFDEVGNPRGVNPFTGVDICKYYQNIVESEGKKCIIHGYEFNPAFSSAGNVIYCGLHDYAEWSAAYSKVGITLADICADKNPDYGLLGTNKATEEKLKLFPTKALAQDLVEAIQAKVYAKTGKYVDVMIYGDGCFKDPVGSIWEFADPVTSPGYTEGLKGTPNEIKIKAFADDQFKDLSGKELEDAVKQEIAKKDSNLVGNMAAQGTTPRRYIDLLASLMDLTSGSGDAGTPVVLVRNYRKNYSNA